MSLLPQELAPSLTRLPRAGCLLLGRVPQRLHRLSRRSPRPGACEKACTSLRGSETEAHSCTIDKQSPGLRKRRQAEVLRDSRSEGGLAGFRAGCRPCGRGGNLSSGCSTAPPPAWERWRGGSQGPQSPAGEGSSMPGHVPKFLIHTNHLGSNLHRNATQIPPGAFLQKNVFGKFPSMAKPKGRLAGEASSSQTWQGAAAKLPACASPRARHGPDQPDYCIRQSAGASL